MDPITRIQQEIRKLKRQATRLERKKHLTFNDEINLIDLSVKVSMYVSKLIQLGQRATRRF